MSASPNPDAAAATTGQRFVLALTPSHEHIDLLGHVSNIVFVGWLQEAATAHALSLGYDVDAFRALGGVFVVRAHDIEYLRSALEGEPIEIESWIDSFRPASAVRRTEIRRTRDGALLARAETRWAFVSEAGRPRRIPEELVAAFRDGIQRPLPLPAVDETPPREPHHRGCVRRHRPRRSIGPRPYLIDALPWSNRARCAAG